MGASQVKSGIFHPGTAEILGCTFSVSAAASCTSQSLPQKSPNWFAGRKLSLSTALWCLKAEQGCVPPEISWLWLVLGVLCVQDIISPQQHHLHVLVESNNSILMWREAKRKGIKEKCVSNKRERKILGEKRERGRSTAGNRRRVKEKNGEVGGQNEMLRYRNKQMYEYKVKKPDPGFPFICAGTAPSVPSESPVPWLRIKDTFGLKKTSETIKSNHSSSTAGTTLTHVPKCYILNPSRHGDSSTVLGSLF